MNQDKELEEINAKKMKKLMEEAANAETIDAPLLPKCGNCNGICDEDLLTELKPGAVYCPACVIQAAKAFALSKSFMIEIASNKKKTFARVREFNPTTNNFGEQKIIDVLEMPIISIVGTIDFFKAVPAPGIKKNGK